MEQSPPIPDCSGTAGYTFPAPQSKAAVAPAAGCLPANTSSSLPLSNQPVLSCSQLSSTENLDLPKSLSFAKGQIAACRRFPPELCITLLHSLGAVSSHSAFTPLHLQFFFFLFPVTLNLSRRLEHPFLFQPHLPEALRMSKTLTLPSHLTLKPPFPSPT